VPDAGSDVRNRLGVTKYEPALPDAREVDLLLEDED
jgi:hypothetical protein